MAEQSSSRSVSLLTAPLLLHQGPTTLADWLDISWFYPKGFEKDFVEDARRTWTAYGNGIAYRFFKLEQQDNTLAREDAFAMRWRLACEEILDHEFLAPQCYLGLRVLRWVDEDPEWMSERVSRVLDPSRPPKQAQDVAIVMRRLAPENYFHSYLERDGELPDFAISKLCALLQTLHTRGTAKSLVTFRDDPSLLHSIMIERYRTPLQRFILSHGSFLDPFSQITFEHLRGFIGHFLRHHREVFVSRLLRGCYVDCHGNLGTGHIALDSEDQVVVLGRLMRDTPERFGDYLSDIASLVVDFEVQGHSEVANAFEEEYFATMPQNDALYRFYKTVAATQRAQAFFTGHRIESDNMGPAYLSYALKTALGIKEPFLIIVSARAENRAQHIADNLQMLTNARCLLPDDVPPRAIGKFFPASAHLDRVLQEAENIMARKESVIACWPLNREEERLVIQRMASELGAPLLFVSIDETQMSSSFSHGRRKLASLNANISQGLPELNTPHLFFEESLPAPDLTLSILRELASSVHSICKSSGN